MSFILDALKKSENERQQQSGGEFSGVPTGPAEARPARWFWLLAALLAVNIAVLLGILLRPDVTPAIDIPPVATDPAAELADGPDPGRQSAAASPSFAEQVANARRQAADVPVVTGSERMPDATTPDSDSAAATVVSQPVAAPATQRSRNIPTIEQLRLDGSLNLPELHVDIHVYSENPADRFVFINMQKHREQSRLKEGPVVREITAEGVILQFEGRSFLVSRE